MKAPHTGKNPGGRQNAEELPGYRDDQAVYAVSQRLEHGADDNAVTRKQETQADQAQGRYADLQHMVGGVEQQKELCREQLEGGQAKEHDGHCDQDTQAGGIHDAFAVSGPVIIGNDRDHAVVESEYRHENETLQFEIYAKDRYGRRGKGSQDFVHAISHDRGDGLHDNGGETYRVDNSDNALFRDKAFHSDIHIRIPFIVEKQGKEHCQELPGDRGDGGSADTQRRETVKTEDHNRVKDNVGDGADSLGKHIINGFSSGLHNAFQHHLQIKSDRKNQADLQVLYPIFDDRSIRSLTGKINAGSEYAKQGKRYRAQNGKEDTILCGLLRFLWILFSQRAGKQGVDTDAGARGNGDHQALNRKGHGDGGQGSFINP